jgi:malonyl-CoA decarboxylase
MQRNRFLGDMLAQLFDRPNRTHGKSDNRDIIVLCEALLSAEGEVSGYRLAATVLDRYGELDDPGKLQFFEYLNTALEFDASKIAALSAAYEEMPTLDLFKAIGQAAEPRRQELLRRLNQPSGATTALVSMRVDLLRFVKQHPDLQRTDLDFVHVLRSWFNRGFLVLKQINWDTPARILDKIVAYEAVHQINDWDDLRRRLYPPDRQCFAFFHPSMPDEPLIFVEVALTDGVPGSINDVLSEGRTPIEAEKANVAVFYSISNCQKGLRNISFGNLLIKQVVAELSLEIPTLKTFITLSPIPGLNAWLKQQTKDAEIGPIANAMLAGDATEDDCKALAARYLLLAKRANGAPLDPVARFHLGNGAEAFGLHAQADTSPNGLAQSSGVMVNYLYDLSKTETQHEDFVLQNVVAASPSVTALSTAALTIHSKDMIT